MSGRARDAEGHVPAAGVEVRRLSVDDLRDHAEALAAVLIDVVDGGASVSFMAPLAPLDAIGWSLEVADAAARGTVVFGAFVDAELVGTVQLVPAWQPNQPHRADIAKLLVRRNARRRGIAAMLLQALEAEAAAMGRWMLTLDTAIDGNASGVYERAGYIRAGVLPDYALNPYGGLTGTILYYKALPRTGD